MTRKQPYTLEHVARRLRELRTARDATQYDFALRAGIRHNTYGHYETGYNYPSLRHLIELANAWNFDIDEVLL